MNKRIFFYIGELGYGGAERVISTLCNSFSKDGFDVFLILEKHAEKEYHLEPGINKIYLTSSNNDHSAVGGNISRIIELRKYIKKYEPICMCSFLPGCNIRNVLCNIGLKTKTYISVRTSPKMEYSNTCVRILMQMICTLASGIVFQTKSAMAMYPQFAKNKYYIIPNPISSDCFSNCVKMNENHTLVAVGRLAKEKNYRMMIDGFSEVCRRIPDAQLEIWGDGDLREEIEEWIDDCNLRDKVALKGTTDNVAEMYSKASIFILTSDFEGMPNSLMEAMASGLAVVSTDCPSGGPREIITDGVDGALVRCRDVKTLASILVELCLNKKRRIQLGENAKKKAQEFQTDTVYSRWKNVFLYERND